MSDGLFLKNFRKMTNKIAPLFVLYIQNSRKRNRISFFIGLDFKVLNQRGSRETAALVVCVSGGRCKQRPYKRPYKRSYKGEVS